MTDGVLQADGNMRAEPRMRRRTMSPRPSSTWRACRWKPMSLFMTVMATKMPFFGRG